MKYRFLEKFAFKRKARHLRVGAWGERLTCKEMQRIGLDVLVVNFQVHGVGEVDIIGRDGDCLVFVEVKTRHHGQEARPGDSISAEKRQKLWKTAQYYMRHLGDLQPRFRFDVAEVTYTSAMSYQVLYLPNAFQPW